MKQALATSFRVLCSLLVLGSPTVNADRTLYVATGGSDLNPGSRLEPLASLRGALSKVDFAAFGDHAILIRGGTYFGHSVIWNRHSPDYSVTIEPYPGETVIFDGIRGREMQVFSFALSRGRGMDSNVTIRGLTFRNYLSWAIFLGYGGDWQGGNVIEANVFYNIGDRFLPRGQECNSNQMGYAAIAIEESGGNLIRGNTFANLENCAMNERFMHAVYLQHGAHDNEIVENHVYLSSGDPFKVRNGSSDNLFRNNYSRASGENAFLLSCSEEGEAPSLRNLVAGNRIVYPYPSRRRVEVTTNCGRIPTTFIDQGQSVHIAEAGALR